MKEKNWRTIPALFILVISVSSCSVQTQGAYGSSRKVSKATLRAYRKDPHWISMMNDSSANYYDILLAYDQFWKKRPEPNPEEEFERKQNEKEGKEEEEEEEENKRSLVGRLFHSEEKDVAESSQYMIEYKKFKTWKKDVLPYVQPDGSILTQAQRLDIYKNQRP
ncbi:MAG: hypothetical protein J7604_09220 [Sporocytophaga sp.]|uniref:hypothetical protein n=1 Tax=Sporocytophaga sp. TaxID=2231183 RepID=UPI001B22D8CC|nr:hypothetical protein [Sporocytophaga sp.]MBO9700375.1 hypothetical protein [Sporocytophaga sp.]